VWSNRPFSRLQARDRVRGALLPDKLRTQVVVVVCTRGGAGSSKIGGSMRAMAFVL